MAIANRRLNHYTSAMRITRHAALLIALVCILLPLPCQAEYPAWRTRSRQCMKIRNHFFLAFSIAQQRGETNITSLTALMPTYTAYMKTTPVCPAGGTYALGTNGMVTCSMSGEQHRFRPFKGPVIVIHVVMALVLLIPLLMLWWRHYDARFASVACARVAVASVCLGLAPWLMFILMLYLPWHTVLDMVALTPLLKVELSDSLWFWLLGLVFLCGVFSVLYGHIARSRLKQTAATMSLIALLGQVLGFITLAMFVWQLYIIYHKITMVNIF